MSTRFFSNHGNQSLLQKFQWMLRNNRDTECFDALVGSLRVSGYFAIRPSLEYVPHIRILIGSNVNATVAEFRQDIQTAAYRRDIEAGIVRFVEDVASGKVQLRAHPSQRLQTNLYICRPRRFGEQKPGAVIAGPSNLTGAGLPATGEASPYKLNVLLYNFEDVRFATDEFERLWKEAVPVPAKTLQEVRDATHLSTTVTPQDVYWKLLAEHFGPVVAADIDGIEGFKLLAHQVDAVNQACRLLDRHNGCVLADVVGMGKAMLAALVAKKWRATGTLIVCSPATQEDWQWASQQCGLDNVRLVAGNDLPAVTDLERYDLVIADEDCQLPAGKKVILTKPIQRLFAEATVRCSRTDLKENEPYRKDLEKRRITFPKVKKLRAIYYPLPTGTGDPKLEIFLAYLKTELFSGINSGGKLIVFSEIKETTDCLCAELAKAGYQRVLAVDAANRQERLPVVQANFDASVPDKERANDYDILITTELLAERVNLHRANVIVNYDIPTTAARLQQRMNRINCLGVSAPKLYIYNFYPTDRVTGDMELRKSAIAKLHELHAALGKESEIFSSTDLPDNFGLFENAHEEPERDDRLRLLMELRQFRQQNPEGFRRIQSLPLRTRVCRADSSRAGNTVVFLRSGHRDALYRLKADSTLEEITLREAVTDLRVVDPRERAMPLHDAHHRHVNAAVARFQEPAPGIILSESFDHPVKW